jgi:hypothetical protein
MEHKKPGAAVAAYSVAAVSALIVVALIAVPAITGTRLDGTSIGMMLLPFCFVLSGAFFRVANDLQELRDECRSLRERVNGGVRGEAGGAGRT